MIIITKNSNSKKNEAAPSKAPFKIRNLFADNLDEHPFFSLAVKFPVENLLPGTKMQLPFCDGNNNFPTHDLALVMGIAVILSGSVVLVAA